MTKAKARTGAQAARAGFGQGVRRNASMKNHIRCIRLLSMVGVAGGLLGHLLVYIGDKTHISKKLKA